MNQPYVPPTLYVTWQEPESRAIFVGGRLIRLASDTEALAILSRSGGRRQTDPYEVFAELMPSDDGQRRQGWFLLRGVRHLPNAEENVLALKVGDELKVFRQTDNPKNPRALQLYRDKDALLGWMRAPRSKLAVDLRGFAPTGTSD